MDFQYQIWQNTNAIPARFIRIEKVIDRVAYKVTAEYQNGVPITSWEFNGAYSKVLVDNYAMNLFASGWSLLNYKKDNENDQ